MVYQHSEGQSVRFWLLYLHKLQTYIPSFDFLFSSCSAFMVFSKFVFCSYRPIETHIVSVYTVSVCTLLLQKCTGKHWSCLALLSNQQVANGKPSSKVSSAGTDCDFLAPKARWVHSFFDQCCFNYLSITDIPVGMVFGKNKFLNIVLSYADNLLMFSSCSDVWWCKYIVSQITNTFDFWSNFGKCRPVYAVTVCPSLHLSITRWYCTKMATYRIMQIMLYDSPGTLVFWC